MHDVIIRVAEDFSHSPGWRNKEHSSHSGEEFKDAVLKKGRKATIILDGVRGYESSWL